MSEKDTLYKKRHSLAHVLAIVALEHDPKAKITLGPPVDDGFYYDIEFSADKTPTPADMTKMQKSMRKLVGRGLEFEKKEISGEDALELFKGNQYKEEMITALADKGETITTYTSGEFTDLCEGPHVDTTKDIDPKSFKLDRIAGAYWRGDEKNTMLTRIYGLAFDTPEELKEYEAQREEAKKRDHRKIGQDQELFFIDEMVGKGLIMWLPNGAIMREEVEKLAIAMEDAGDYKRVITPHIAREELYLTSGHLPYYKDDMYPSMEMDDGTYYLRGMNCPHHHRVYTHKPHSYRELPLRLAEYGTVYRNERSGTLAGLLRVRGLAMNDAHIYCRKDQIKDEFKRVMQLTMDYFEIFDLKDYWFRLSKWSPDHTEKYIDEPDNWEYSQSVLREVLDEMKVKYVETDDEAAFYGPKVDVQFKSVIGREETMSTVQLDFLAKERFGLSYTDEKGEENGEVFVVHRAPLSTHERFLAFLIEHYAGKFPTWLSPTQISILPIGEKHRDYAKEVYESLKMAGIRSELNLDDETLGKKIREVKMAKTPYFAVIGDKEVEQKSVNLESRDHDTIGEKSVDELIEHLKKEIIERS